MLLVPDGSDYTVVATIFSERAEGVDLTYWIPFCTISQI